LGPTINCTVPLTERQGQRAGCSKRHFGGAHCCTRPQSVRRGAFSCGQEDRGGVAALAPCIFWCAELSFKMICSFTPDHQSRKQLMICSTHWMVITCESNTAHGVGSPCAGPCGACGGRCSTPGTRCRCVFGGYARILYLRSPAFLALILDALVGADARPHALLALAPAAIMLAYLRPPAFLAPALVALVGADARPQALLALAPDAVMLAYLRSAAFFAPALFTVMGASFGWRGGWDLLADCAGLCLLSSS
jgi:hypothetical protein